MAYLKKRKRKKDNDQWSYTQRKFIIVIILLTNAPLMGKIVQITINNRNDKCIILPIVIYSM